MLNSYISYYISIFNHHHRGHPLAMDVDPPLQGFEALPTSVYRSGATEAVEGGRLEPSRVHVPSRIVTVSGQGGDW